MSRFYISLMCSVALVMVLGCGGAGDSLEQAAEPDELSKWVEDNPAPETVEISD
ncbi:hypothetical protein [Rubripirellula obstinata]|nr:hypothetical protein [Rubripirellula obstinata]